MGGWRLSARLICQLRNKPVARCGGIQSEERNAAVIRSDTATRSLTDDFAAFGTGSTMYHL